MLVFNSRPEHYPYRVHLDKALTTSLLTIVGFLFVLFIFVQMGFFLLFGCTRAIAKVLSHTLFVMLQPQTHRFVCVILAFVVSVLLKMAFPR